MSALEWIVGALLLIGAFLTFVGALGVVRFPDVLTRMSAASKTSTLGAICMLAGYGITHSDLGTDLRALAAIGFLALSTPIAAHAIGRAAHRRGEAVGSQTRLDELARDEDPQSRTGGANAGRPRPGSH